jgi:hypothetical protein
MAIADVVVGQTRQTTQILDPPLLIPLLSPAFAHPDLFLHVYCTPYTQIVHVH